MRVTNNMITSNTKSNINSNKVLVNQYNTQMTTQKKIAKPSENPVIAIRSLRMQTNLSHINQYLDNNIADVEAWYEVTETALTNMKNILTDIRTQCVNGSTDTLKDEDRETILKALQQLADQVYSEGNADYAGRTVFTGYRTNLPLTFKEDEKETTYTIEQKFDYTDLADHRYYWGNTEVPADAANPCQTEVGTRTFSRARLAYDQIESVDKLTITKPGSTPPQTTDYTIVDAPTTPGTPAPTGANTIVAYESEEQWYSASADPKQGKVIGDNDIIFIKSTGEFIFGEAISHQLKADKSEIDLSYTKTGFTEGEARPEYYYSCTRKTPDMDQPDVYTKENQQIMFEISNGITIPANTQASDVFDTSISRDVNELINVVSASMNARDKVDKIKQMMKQARYNDDESQTKLQTYLDAAEKEASYADDNLQKTYSQYITNFQGYMDKVNAAITNVGSLKQRLDMTKTRVENQKTTVEKLKSENEDRDISDIIIDYTAAYNAYTASLQAAAKVEGQTLLNYL